MVIGAHSNYYDIYRQNPRNTDNPANVDLRDINGSFTLFLEIMKERIAADPIHCAQWYFLEKRLLLWNWNILAGQGDIFEYPVKYSLYQKSTAALASYSIMKFLHYWLFSFAILSIIFILKEANEDSEKNVIVTMFLYHCILYQFCLRAGTIRNQVFNTIKTRNVFMCGLFHLQSFFISKI